MSPECACYEGYQGATCSEAATSTNLENVYLYVLGGVVVVLLGGFAYVAQQARVKRYVASRQGHFDPIVQRRSWENPQFSPRARRAFV